VNQPPKFAAGLGPADTAVSPAGTGGCEIPSAEPAGHGARAIQGATARVAVLGASGYTGQEFIRLVLDHPGIELAALLSREHGGDPADAVLAGLDARARTLPAFADPAALGRLVADQAVDTIVACLPHGAFRELLTRDDALARSPVRMLDLSQDHRDGAEGFLYGLPEALRAWLNHAQRIANPGCYPTAATLALLPALESGWVADPVMVSALSGVSGAGRSGALRTSFVELDGGASIYRAGTEHAHVAEMARNFERLAGEPLRIGFTPQLAPMARGILLTATAPLTRAVAPAEARRVYQERFEHEPFVRLLDEGAWPETRAVRASNRCDIAVTTLHGGRTLLATAALDNLVKGAAGQAIQNLNLMLGWPEITGLPRHGSPW